MLRPVNICFHNCSKRLLHGQKRDPFSVLDLESCASFEQVKQRYLLLVKQLHPDMLGTTSDKHVGKEKGRSFLELQEAYEKLQKLYANGNFRNTGKRHTKPKEEEYSRKYSNIPPSPRCLRAGNNGELVCYEICDGCRSMCQQRNIDWHGSNHLFWKDE